MVITLVRGLILYITITVAMRFMGKRQLGELQPTELVITILFSEIASVPLENLDSSLLNSLFVIIFLVCLEIINSVINMKSSVFNRILQGKSAVVIENGKLNQKKLRDLRYTTQDLLEQLRQKDIFDIKDVQFAIVETNGSLSVKRKSKLEPLSAEQYGIKSKEKPIPTLVISDGKIIKPTLKNNNINLNQITSILNNEKVNAKDVLILLVSDANNYTIVRKESV